MIRPPFEPVSKLRAATESFEIGSFIKICGITRFQDALKAVELGADALGFIAYPHSPRYVSPETAAKIIAELQGVRDVRKVLVCVDAAPEQISAYIACGIDTVQLHGSENADFAKKVGQLAPHVWKALRPRSKDDVLAVRDYPCEALLVDAFSEKMPGGTGKRCDWELAKLAKSVLGCNVILAGGLSPENIPEAVAKVRPWGIDVNSGVESSPGIKDHIKLERTFKLFRKQDQAG